MILEETYCAQNKDLITYIQLSNTGELLNCKQLGHLWCFGFFPPPKCLRLDNVPISILFVVRLTVMLLHLKVHFIIGIQKEHLTVVCDKPLATKMLKLLRVDSLGPVFAVTNIFAGKKREI